MGVKAALPLGRSAPDGTVAGGAPSSSTPPRLRVAINVLPIPAPVIPSTALLAAMAATSRGTPMAMRSCSMAGCAARPVTPLLAKASWVILARSPTNKASSARCTVSSASTLAPPITLFCTPVPVVYSRLLPPGKLAPPYLLLNVTAMSSAARPRAAAAAASLATCVFKPVSVKTLRI